jgi:hypothetical protein
MRNARGWAPSFSTPAGEHLGFAKNQQLKEMGCDGVEGVSWLGEEGATATGCEAGVGEGGEQWQTDERRRSESGEENALCVLVKEGNGFPPAVDPQALFALAGNEASFPLPRFGP